MMNILVMLFNINKLPKLKQVEMSYSHNVKVLQRLHVDYFGNFTLFLPNDKKKMEDDKNILTVLVLVLIPVFTTIIGLCKTYT